MTFIHYAKKEMHIKIVYAGAHAVGKSTNFEILRQTKPLAGKHILFDDAKNIFFKFLPLTEEDFSPYSVKMHLFFLGWHPNLIAFQTFLFKGMDGLIFVVDSRKSKIAESVAFFQNLSTTLNAIGVQIQHLPTVFQFNKQDCKDILNQEELMAVFDASLHNSVFATATHNQGVHEAYQLAKRAIFDKISTPN